jgi:hypothetical protein
MPKPRERQNDMTDLVKRLEELRAYLETYPKDPFVSPRLSKADLDTIISALSSGREMVMVPREPTPEMREAGMVAAMDNVGGDVIGTIEVQTWITKAVWQAMIAAAPLASKEEGE